MESPQATTDARWRDWVARGAASDRRSGRWARGVLVVLVVAVGLRLVATVLAL